MKDQLFILLGKLTFAMLCILAFLAVGKFVGHGIFSAWDRQAQGEQAIHHKNMVISPLVVMLILWVDDVNSRFVVSAYCLMTANAIGVITKITCWVHWVCTSICFD